MMSDNLATSNLHSPKTPPNSDVLVVVWFMAFDKQ